MSKARPLIAVVDDEKSVRIAVERLLRSANFDVETFPSGIELLEALKTHRPACVVLDLHMPHMDGFTVQTRLTEASIRLPMVVITGHDATETRERALAGGASAYLRKPMDDQTLLEAIANAIAQPSVTSGTDLGELRAREAS
ncbi:MAG: response regulator [Planctomycetia bacterium]|nr:response regulator [Planctomycetia bacterium]